MTDAFQIKNHLHFGAVIYISCPSGSSNYYMYSNGISFKSVICLTDSEGPIDPAKCLFTVTPALKFQEQKFLQRIVNKRYAQDGEGAEIDEKKTKVYIDQFDFQLKQNNKLREEQLKFPIKYGQSFMLQHKFSCKYLSFSKDVQTNQYILQLSEIPSSSSSFSLGACYNYQKDINTYIPFNSAAFLNIKIHEMLKLREMNLLFSPMSIFDPWGFVEEGWSKIQLGLYQPCEENEYKSICYGDSVWIFHLESGSFVKVLDNQEVTDSVIVKKIKYSLGFINEERDYQKAEPPKILIQKVENEMSAEKFGLWKIISASKKDKQHKIHPNPERFIGGRIKFDQEVRFFNVRYHSFLSVRKIKKGRSKFQFQFSMEDREEENTVFTIKSLASSAQYVTTEDLFLVQNVLTETYLTLSQPFAINETKAPLTPSLSYKKEDNLKFTKIDFLQESQNNSILSILPFLNDGIESFKNCSNGRITNKEEVMLKLMSQNLTELLIFSFDLTEGFQASQSKLGKMTFNHFLIQKLLREQGVVDKLMEILDSIKLVMSQLQLTNESEESLKIQDMLKIVKKYSVGLKMGDKGQYPLETKLIKKIINSTFKILRNCCKSNTDNSQYLFHKIDVFVSFLGMQTYAQDFFIDSFHNESTLRRIGTEELRAIIEQYIYIYEKTGNRSEKLFLLLQKMICFEGKGLSQNQLEVFRLFFYLGNPLMVSIEHSDEIFTVEGIELTQFCEQKPQLASYLAKQIKFYAYLTADRNYVCSKVIKKMFPLSIVFKYYTKKSTSLIYEQLKDAFLHVIINSYLNERPRFIETYPSIFSMSNERQESMNEAQLPQFQAQIRMMKQQGMSQSSIEDIISCIHQENTMNLEQLSQLKEIVINEIEKISNGEKSKNLYSSQTESYMICLKYLIKLSVFKREEEKEVERLIKTITAEIAKSLAVVGENNTKLESANFRQLLLEMVEKNVIKKFDFSVKYDGIEDEVNSDNICSIFVNYAFYQNILVEEKEKESKERREADSAMTIMLELIGIYSEMIVSEKFSFFQQQIISRYNVEKYKDSKQQFVENTIINRILSSEAEEKEQILSLLALLFYNSNTYLINFYTMDRILGEIFGERRAMKKISHVLFTVDEKETNEFNVIVTEFKNIKLLMETCEIWLNAHQIKKQASSKYDPIIMLFLSKMKKLTQAIMPGLREDMLEGTLAGIWAASSIRSEKQQIVSNLNIEGEVLDFISSYHLLLNQIKMRKIKNYNKLIIPVFRSCFLFLFTFCYNCPENKDKVYRVIKDEFVKNYFKELGSVEFGETMLIIEFLKNNYEECIEFFNKNSEFLQKKFNYTLMHSQLLLTMMKFYNEPIQVNLHKMFISVFDFTSFKNFLWLRPDSSELNLDVSLFSQELAQEPFVYHINALEIIILVMLHVEESRNTLRNHIRKCLPQEYLYQLLKVDDYYSRDNSNKSILKLAILLKQKIMKILELAYFSDDVRKDALVFDELKTQNELLIKLIEEAPARQENQDFKRIILMKGDLDTEQDKKIDQLFNSVKGYHMSGDTLIEIRLNSIFQYCSSYERIVENTGDIQLQRIRAGCQQIKKRVDRVYEILHKSRKKEGEEDSDFPVPSEWLFNIAAANRDEESMEKKRFTSAVLIESMFNKAIYTKFEQNECQLIQHFFKILKDINLKQFLFLRKLSQFIEDAFEKLANDGDEEMSDCLKMLLKFLTLWIKSSPPERVNDIRNQIGKSELIFPILNYFQTCQFDKTNKEIFLCCLEFYNELLGEDGNCAIQTIFNQYFTNKADSIEFFMKIKQLFDEINFEDLARYKCKKLYEGMEALSRDCRLEKGPEFILLKFLICLCKGSFRDNQIFLSSLSNTSNFNIMSGIWEILKYQSQKYRSSNLINVKNYNLITQCFSTIKELVEGPCAENQNEFLKRDFFLTVLDYFQFESKDSDLTLEMVLQDKLNDIHKISPSFTEKLKIYLNQEKITLPWMVSQVKYRCINLICSLMAENVTKESKNQLETFPVDLIVKELDRVYHRFDQLGLDYNYDNLEVREEREIVLPLGFKLYELLRLYPEDKVPESSPGIDFFKSKSRVVEVVHQKLCFVVFPQVPQEISEGFMNKFLESVDRTSINSKLRGLQDSQVQNRQSDYPYGYLVFLLVVTLTVLDLIIYGVEAQPTVAYFKMYAVIRGYGVDQTIQVAAGVVDLFIIMLALIFAYFQVKGAVYFKEEIRRISQRDIQRWEKFKKIVVFLWRNLTYFYYGVIVIITILSMFNPFFDALLLIAELNRRSETFAATISAISATLDQLLVVLMFMFISTYVLTGILYYDRAAAQFPVECATLYNCFVFSVDVGFKQDAGLAGYVDDSDTLFTAYANENLGEILINFTYLFIIKVIIEQIIGAIIVDKFVALRESKDKIEKDEDSVCFICGLDRNLLDREENGFECHKSKYHNRWNYFEFLMYLRKSPIHKFSGIERYVYEEQRNGKLNWFPINRSLHLELKNQESIENKGKEDEDEQELEKVNKLLDAEILSLNGEMGQIWDYLNLHSAQEAKIEAK